MGKNVRLLVIGLVILFMFGSCMRGCACLGGKGGWGSSSSRGYSKGWGK